LLLKPGFEEQLALVLSNFAYIGTRFYASQPWSPGDPDRYVWQWWDRFWADLLKAPQPYNVFNPGQVFRKDLVERFVADPAMPGIMSAVESSRVQSMEEIVYPTRAVAMGVPATSHPGSHAMRTYDFDADELEILAGDPNVFLVHKIAHGYQRAAVDRLLRQGANPKAAAERLALRAPAHGTGRRKQLRASLRQLELDVSGITRGP
jgi:hypothetical protein